MVDKKKKVKAGARDNFKNAKTAFIEKKIFKRFQILSENYNC